MILNSKLIELLKVNPKSNIEITNLKDKIGVVHFIQGKGVNKSISIPNNENSNKEINRFLNLYVNEFKPTEYKINEKEFHCFQGLNSETNIHLYYDRTLSNLDNANLEDCYFNYFVLLTKCSNQALISFIIQKILLKNDKLLKETGKNSSLAFKNYLDDFESKTKLELIKMLLDLSIKEQFTEEVVSYIKKYS